MAESDIDVEELLKDACDFQGQGMGSREAASIKYRSKETNEEFYVRSMIDGLMVRLANRMSNEVKGTNEKISYQIGLITSYVRTHFIINDLILGGDLIEASTLTRKQLESLTRLYEIDDKPLQKLLRKTPNVINAFKRVGKQAYPHLSEIAHFASPRPAELLHVVEPGDGLVGPSMFPLYSEHSHGCYDLQALISLYFLYWLVGKQKEFYPDYNSLPEEKLLLSVHRTALDAGMIRVEAAE